MKYIYFVILFCLFANVSNAQTIRFNKICVLPDTILIPRTIIQTDTGYIIKTNILSPTWKPKISFLNFDETGHLINKHYYGNTSYSYYWNGYQSDLIKDLSENYFTACNKILSNESGCGYICFFKFDNNLDSLWQKDFFYHDSLIDCIYGCGVDRNNNYIAFGKTSYDNNNNLVNNGYYMPFIIKIDNNGNLIYRHVIATSEGDITGFACDQNNHYWLSGSYKYYNINRMPTVFECDSNGQVIWSKCFGPHFFSTDYAPLFIHYLPIDSSILIHSKFRTTFAYFEPYLAKIKNHQIIWDLYGNEDSTISNMFQTIMETPDHYIIATDINDLQYVPGDCSQLLDSTGISNKILKLTPDGNCMWHRRFFIPGLVTDSILDVPHIYHIIQTTDNGFAFIGAYTSWINSHTEAKYPIWFVKTDSLGCDGSGSCSDTAMVLNLLSLPDTICSNDTTWLTFELNGLSAPFTLFSTEGIQVNDIYFIKNPYSVFATDSPFSHFSQPQFWFDTSRVVPNHLYQQFPIIANTSDSIYSVTITLQGYYGRTISHTYNFFVKDCNAGNQLQKSKDEFSLYPNPSTGNFIIEFPENTQNGYLTIANARWQIIKVIPIDKGQTTYQFTEKLPSGVYFIGVDCEQGTAVKKLIVN